mmetsp:Transcript_18605/g.71787  ORF Transcript_18605/g.71787 Transcript_18605/m.71787 type:complete len:201 (+) Transcript_18605:98-700(+)
MKNPAVVIVILKSKITSGLAVVFVAFEHTPIPNGTVTCYAIAQVLVSVSHVTNGFVWLMQVVDSRALKGAGILEKEAVFSHRGCCASCKREPMNVFKTHLSSLVVVVITAVRNCQGGVLPLDLQKNCVASEGASAPKRAYAQVCGVLSFVHQPADEQRLIPIRKRNGSDCSYHAQLTEACCNSRLRISDSQRGQNKRLCN